MITRSRLTLSAALLALIAISTHTSFDGNKTAYAPVKDSLWTMAIYVTPLFIVLVAVIKGKRPIPMFTAAILALLVGGLVEFAYYASHDPSKVFALAISTPVYWLSAVVASLSFNASKP